MLILTEGWANVFRPKSMNEKSSDCESRTGMELIGKFDVPVLDLAGGYFPVRLS